MPSTGNVAQTEIAVGQRYGLAVVIEMGLRSGKRQLLSARMLCDCGSQFVTYLGRLRGGLVKSCGCLRRETARQEGFRRATHGLSRHPLYSTWNGILDRCENPRSQRYYDYGGRGIKVCPEWHDVRVFVSYIERELGPRMPGMSLDRIRNEGHYEPGNVRWNDDAGQYANTERRERDQMTGRFVSAGLSRPWLYQRPCSLLL